MIEVSLKGKSKDPPLERVHLDNITNLSEIPPDNILCGYGKVLDGNMWQKLLKLARTQLNIGNIFGYKVIHDGGFGDWLVLKFDYCSKEILYDQWGNPKYFIENDLENTRFCGLQHKEILSYGHEKDTMLLMKDDFIKEGENWRLPDPSKTFMLKDFYFIG